MSPRDMKDTDAPRDITAADWVRHGQEVERLCVVLDEIAVDQDEMADAFADDDAEKVFVKRAAAIRQAAFLLRYAAPLAEIAPGASE